MGFHGYWLGQVRLYMSLETTTTIVSSNILQVERQSNVLFSSTVVIVSSVYFKSDGHYLTIRTDKESNMYVGKLRLAMARFLIDPSNQKQEPTLIANSRLVLLREQQMAARRMYRTLPLRRRGRELSKRAVGMIWAFKIEYAN